jgi:hypothetical protein
MSNGSRAALRMESVNDRWVFLTCFEAKGNLAMDRKDGHQGRRCRGYGGRYL